MAKFEQWNKGVVEMDWYIILAIVLGIPIVLLPIAFVWYLNVSGLYQVIRDVRQRQRRRAEALREAEEIIKTKTSISTAPEERALAGKGAK